MSVSRLATGIPIILHAVSVFVCLVPVSGFRFWHGAGNRSLQMVRAEDALRRSTKRVGKNTRKKRLARGLKVQSWAGWSEDRAGKQEILAYADEGIGHEGGRAIGGVV